MCGLVAITSLKDNGFTTDEVRIFEEMMIFNQLRGDDSTGAVTVDKDDIWSYLKCVGGFKAFSHHPGFNTFRKGILDSGRLVFGHGRWATRGHVTVNNAHPFHIKEGDSDLIFMHNGTLDYTQALPGYFNYDVDSEYLGAMIAKHGAEEALSTVSGAIAALWWDSNANTFNFYHNKDRPLCYMQTKAGEFYINSELWILEYVNWKFKLGIPDKNIYQIKENDLHTIAVNGPEAGKYQITNIKRKAVAVSSVRVGWANYAGLYEDDTDDIVVRRPEHTSTVPPITSQTPLPENKDFWDRDIEVIEFVDGKKIINYKDKRVVTIPNVNPPERDLLRIYEHRPTGDITKVYSTENHGLLYVNVSFKAWLADKEREKKAVRTTERISEDKRLVRFSTRHPVTKKKVKHTGQILQNSFHPHLQHYSNSEDGDTYVGRKINVEILYAEEQKMKSKENGREEVMVKVVCAEIKPKQDMYIDYKFYTGKFTKQQVERIKFFAGEVGSLRVADQEEQKLSGACCVGTLYNVTAIEEPPANIPVEAADEKKTVH